MDCPFLLIQKMTIYRLLYHIFVVPIYIAETLLLPIYIEETEDEPMYIFSCSCFHIAYNVMLLSFVYVPPGLYEIPLSLEDSDQCTNTYPLLTGTSFEREIPIPSVFV
nr:MAG TPA: hypothetical protein [Caudoviricetes sp.]